MAVKYFNPTTPPGTYLPGALCSENVAMALGGSVAFDEYTYALHPGLGCWRVTGIPIDINGSAFSVMMGFEMFNVNVRSSGSEGRAVPTQLALEGPVIGRMVG